MVTTSQGDSKRGSLPPVSAPRTLEGALTLVHECMEQAGLTFGHGTDNAWDESVQLLLAAMDLPPHAGDEVLGLPVSADQWATICSWVEERVDNRVPLPYLTGTAWFAGLPFHCDRRALVPRSPLGEVILDAYGPWWSGPPPRRILDLCCGGGAIGIAAALHQADADVFLADIDEDALALAERNIALHEISDRVVLRRGDLFDAVQGERFDLILSNPPYVDAHDLAAMPDEYHKEPPIGLGSGVDGLDMARRILSRARGFLSNDGMLLLEVGNSWAALDELLFDLPLTWLDFSDGGHGVLVVRASELEAMEVALASR